MQIETKLNFDDTVWLMYDNRPRQFFINKIDIVCNKLDYIVEYGCALLGEPHIMNSFREYELDRIAFLNKKDLVNSLL